MKKCLSLKTTLLGLSCAGALSALAFSPSPSIPAGFGNLPLYFEANPDQASNPARFITRGCNYQFLLSPTEVQIALGKSGVKPADVRMNFAGANPGAQMSGDIGLPGKINYLIGNNPAQWHTGLATFAQVRVEQLYPGINLVYYGNQQRLEYDFNVAPGANPEAIGIHFDGVDKISVDAQGALILAVGESEIRQPAPLMYQMVHGQRQAIGGGYRLVNARTVAFAVGKYDHELPMVIDPILNFSTYFGGNSSDTAWAVALDTNGFVYIAGQTLSSQFFPTNAFQPKFGGGGIIGDAFVAKLTTNAQSLVYFTYLGGNADDAAYALAVDAASNVYVTGFTDSPNFPVKNPIPGGAKIGGTFNQFANGYLADAFVAELNTGGSNLIYSSYLGGAGADAAYSIALDSSNNAYVTGFSYSTNFPTTPNAFQNKLAVTNWAYQPYFNANAFVSEIAAGGSNLLYSTYLGGTNFDWGKGIAVDLSNNVYVTGLTASTNFPTTNALQQQFVSAITTTNAGSNNVVLVTNFFNGYLLNGTTNVSPASDAFVAKFAPGCTSLVYSTFLGGTNQDVANGIAVDGSGNAYVTGWTVSTNFPNTITNLPGLYNGLTNNSALIFPLITNAFLTQITWNGSNAGIGYSTVFGGTNFGIDVGYGVTVDLSGNVFVVGASSTTNFPAINTPALTGSTNAGGSDAFVIAFNPNAASVLYSACLGGSGNDYGYGIAVDSLTNAYLVGTTFSPHFPLFNAGQLTLNGPSDAFLARIDWAVPSPEITTQPTNQTTGVGQSVSLVTIATGASPLSYQWQFQGTNLPWTNLVNSGNISGATNATLNISNAQTTNSGNYQLIITNFAGSVTSAVAVLTVTNIATSLNPLASQTVAVGSNVTFTVSGSPGTLPLVFQWQENGINLTNGPTGSGSIISGATNDPLVISNAQISDSGNYWLIVTNPAGSVTSTVAILTVTAAPLIVVPPTNQTVGLGATIISKVSAAGVAPLSYQWLVNGTNPPAGGDISGGVTSSSLIITNAQLSDGGAFTVIVTNLFGSVTSSPPAVLTVLAAPLFGPITAGTNGSFILSGVGGTNSGTYFVLTSTNLAIPRTLWTPVATNQFGTNGQFVFTNIAPTDAPQLFYLLQSR